MRRVDLHVLQHFPDPLAQRSHLLWSGLDPTAVLVAHILLQVRLPHPHGAADAHRAQLPGLNVPAHRNRMDAQPLGDFVDGQEAIIVSHSMLMIACVCIGEQLDSNSVTAQPALGPPGDGCSQWNSSQRGNDCEVFAVPLPPSIRAQFALRG